MINTPGKLFKLLEKHMPLMYEGAGSVFVSLSTPDGLCSIGKGAMLPKDDPEYDALDVLRGLPSFIGKHFDPETGVEVVGDQAEISVLPQSVLIGRPVEGWTAQLQNFDGSIVEYRVKNCIQDRTVGAYRLPLEILKATGTGRHIERDGEGGV